MLPHSGLSDGHLGLEQQTETNRKAEMDRLQTSSFPTRQTWRVSVTLMRLKI